MTEAKQVEAIKTEEPKPKSSEARLGPVDASRLGSAEPAGQLDSLSVDANQLIELLAKELHGIPQIKAPAWAPFVKTGAHKERPPARSDWWYVRTAAVLRTVARLGPVGTSKLRTKFGGKHSRGFKSERFARGSGSIIRKAMQQLEKAGLIKQAAKGVHKGRVITEKASVMMSSIALKVKVTPKKQIGQLPIAHSGIEPKAIRAEAQHQAAAPKAAAQKTEPKAAK